MKKSVWKRYVGIGMILVFALLASNVLPSRALGEWQEHPPAGHVVPVTPWVKPCKILDVWFRGETFRFASPYFGPVLITASQGCGITYQELPLSDHVPVGHIYVFLDD